MVLYGVANAAKDRRRRRRRRNRPLNRKLSFQTFHNAAEQHFRNTKRRREFSLLSLAPAAEWQLSRSLARSLALSAPKQLRPHLCVCLRERFNIGRVPTKLLLSLSLFVSARARD